MGAEIDRLEIVVESSAEKANRQLNTMIKRLEKASAAISGIDADKLSKLAGAFNTTGKAVQDSTNKTKSYSSAVNILSRNTSASNSQMKKFTSALGNYVAKTTLATNKTKSLSQVYRSFYTSLFPIIRGVKSLGKSIESSMDYIETFNYFNVTMDKIGKEFSSRYKEYGYDSAESYADSFSSRLNDLTKKMTGYEVGGNGVLSLKGGMNLGLDPNQIMNYQASVAAVTNSVGLVGETSVNTSKALSMLAADMSSFKNVDLKTVMTNMQSGLIGQSRALYKYGIDITNATLQTYAYKYGLSTAVSEMTQADKMQLRLLAILDQSKVAWGDQANTINSVANQYRIMKQQISNVARMIGNLLMPIIKAVLPFVNGLLIATQRLVGFIGGLFGIDFGKIMDGISSGYSGFDTDSLDDGMSDVADSAGATSDNLSDANKNAKKLQNTIFGFDQINKLNDNSDSDSSSGNSGAGAGDGGAGGIDLSNEIASALADYEAVWNKAFEDSVNKAQIYADRITSVFSNMWSKIKQGDYIGLGEYIAGGVNSVFESIESVFNWDNLGKPITEFVTAFTTTFNSLMYSVDFVAIGNTIGNGIDVITNTMYLYLTTLDWLGVGTAIADGINGAVESIDWTRLGQTIGAWFMKLPKIVYGFVTNLNWDEVGVAIGTSINGFFIEFDGKTIAGGINGLVNGILTTLKDAIKTVDWSEVARAVGDVLGNLDWGTLAKVGLAVGAVKLAGAFGSLLSLAFSECFTEALKIGLNKFIPQIGSALAGSKIGQVFSLISSGAGTFGESIAAVLGVSLPQIIALTGGIALVVAGIVDLWNTSETFRDGVKDMWSQISDAFSYAKTRIWDDGVKPLWDSLKEFFGSLYELYESSGMKDVFEDIVLFVGNTLTGAFTSLVATVGNVIGTIAGVLSGFIDILSGVIEFVSGVFTCDWDKAWGGVEKIVEGFVGVVESFFNGLWEQIRITFSPIVKWFSDKFESAREAVELAFETIGTWFTDRKNDITKAMDSISNWFKEKYESARKYVNAAFQNIGRWFTDRKNDIQNGMNSIANWFSTKFTMAINFVHNAFSGIGRWFTDRKNDIVTAFSPIADWFSGVFQGAYNAVTRIWDGIKGYFCDIANWIVEPISGAVNGVIKGINWVLDLVGVEPIEEWTNIPYFAKGSGGVAQDTLGVVNDQKGSTYKELVMLPNGKSFIPEGRNVMLPLSKGTKIMPADQTKALMGGMPHFASGIGDFFGGLWAKAKDFTGNIIDYIENPSKILQIAIDKFTNISSGVELFSSMAGNAVKFLFDNSVGFIKEKLESWMPKVDYTPGAGVEQWRALAKKALQITGQFSEFNLNRLLYQMQTESGGNPNAINLWDSNAMAGIPSKGLMQVIDPTFQRWALPPYNKNIYDPLSNMIASIRYAVNRYGSLAAAYSGHGYADGGFPQVGEYFYARESGPELVGRVGNRSGVINNDQIITGIKQAVIEGMMEVYMALDDSDDKAPFILNAVLKTEDDEVIARACERGQMKRRSRMNPSLT